MTPPAARLLVLDAALKSARAGVIEGDRLRAAREGAPETGLADLLPVWAASCLDEAGLAAASLDGIAVTIGPGSFTGLRASLALAHGIGLAAGIPVYGVTVGEAMAALLPDPGRKLWVVTTARRGRLFLERDGEASAFDETDLPTPAGPIALAGDRAADIASRLAEAGHDAVPTGIETCTIAGIAAALRQRLAAGHAPRPAAPLYVDPPEARLPAGGLRPPPQGHDTTPTNPAP
ncbi:tRNA (adenosine(37)-N6)-threonylcarbamoyltransferase complex dimerization subunit type 1 TsaB [Acidiphilium sp. C61]|jgi:tRNA threonylcarbamoyl adenosine modification protein YeaZ|uniref:tRNA (adenosine(37)-N6)-threonylcarbamoyltransferase complex dimerization subunit type 1 TsaB n=1 Tax=Acidiphilium sp. C61 TaxID=1671485 RepID=UPI00157A3ED4|nr:tRNA (adenosine(37)-N6)-threonylcarbamoyltransferase complex dimerization subunit type 1 TsaB [Acidiphilium sp. C61]